MLQDWLFNSLMSWWAIGLTVLLVWAVYFLIVSKLNLPKHVKWYWWTLGLIVTFFISVLSPSNRPKNDVTPNMYQQQSQYEQQIGQKAKESIKEVKPVQDSFESRKEDTKKLFEY